MASSGKTPLLPASDIEILGFSVVIYSGLQLSSAIPAIRRALSELKQSGQPPAAQSNDMASFRDFFDLVGMQEVQRA